jgi:hypothetical protein
MFGVFLSAYPVSIAVDRHFFAGYNLCDKNCKF